MRANRREFLMLAAAGPAALPSAGATAASSKGERAAGNEVWHSRPIRIYHPNVREFELKDLDVKAFVGACADTDAEAVVVSAGGIYAFYPSAVKYHHVSDVTGGRDLMAEISGEAARRRLRVIARVDFSKAREDVWGDHPEWFQRQASGEVYSRLPYYDACPLGGYQNEEFAFEVLREIATRYGVDGFHLNAGGYRGYCYCESCARAYGRPLPKDPEADPVEWRRFLRWRQEALAKHLEGYYDVAREGRPDAFFMGELPGHERSEWERSFPCHQPSMANSFSQLLFSAGGVGSARKSRWWAGLTADRAYAAGARPIINIKMQMRDLRLSQTFMPPAEFSFLAYQSIAHAAGLKLVTLAAPGNVVDSRVLPRLREVFAFMERQREVLDTMEPVREVALVWPEGALLRGYAMEGEADEGPRAEFLGLYTALKGRHAQVGLVYDEAITREALKGYSAVVVPTAVWLDEPQAMALVSYAHDGGRLVVLDSPAAAQDGFRAVPAALAGAIGGSWSTSTVASRYAIAVENAPRTLREIGPLPLDLRYRRVTADPKASVWFRSAQAQDTAAPEDMEALALGEDPLVLSISAGKGRIVYAATGLGEMIAGMGHVDYVTLLDEMLHHDAGGISAIRTDAPSAVGVTLAQWSKGSVVHLVNGLGPAPLDRVAPVGPISVDLEWEGAGDILLHAPEGRPSRLEPERKGGRLKFAVPRLNAFAQIVLRKA